MKIILIFLSASAFSQNLVSNAGFENYKKLPCKLNQFFVQDLLENWNQPIPTTTDCFSLLADSTCGLNPKAIVKYPRTGSGMIAIIIASITRNLREEYKEYVQAKLIQPLTTGHLYYGEVFTMNRNSNSFGYDILKSNNLGIALTEQAISDFRNNAPDHLLLKTVIKANDIIEADDQWHKISGCFLADKPYENVIVGNFDSVRSTKIIRLTTNKEYAIAYQFVDDILVRELSYDISTLAKEMAFCPDQDSLALNAFVVGAKEYRWDDGSIGPQYLVKAKSNAIYGVTISFNECVYKHNFRVNYIPPVSLGADTVLCYQEKILLKPGSADTNYYWSDGSADSVKTISLPGTYWVKVFDDSGCEVNDSINVQFIECPGLVPNVFTPNGDNYNQKFVIENIKNRSWSLQVFNRWGHIVYQSESYQNDWDGKGLADGQYFFLLYSRALDKRIKGWLQIIESRAYK